MFVIDSRIYEACGSNVDSILEDLPSWRPELATSGLAHSREVNSFELKVKCTFLQAIESKMAAHGWGPDPLRGGSSYDGVDLITFPNRDSVSWRELHKHPPPTGSQINNKLCDTLAV